MQLIRPGELAKKVGVSVQAVYRWIHDPECPLPAKRFGLQKGSMVVIDLEKYPEGEKKYRAAKTQKGDKNKSSSD